MSFSGKAAARVGWPVASRRMRKEMHGLEHRCTIKLARCSGVCACMCFRLQRAYMHCREGKCCCVWRQKAAKSIVKR